MAAEEPRPDSSDKLEMSLSTLLVTPVPAIHLIPNFVTPQEELYLLAKTEEIGSRQSAENTSSTAYTSKASAQSWRDISGTRRTMEWGGSILAKSKTLIPLPLPKFMTSEFPNLIQRVVDTEAFDEAVHSPNHVLVNEYMPGQGIFAHQDGPAYFPTVATLSTGSHAILDIHAYTDKETDEGRAYNTTPLFSVFLPPRSLIILSSKVYTAHLHSIAAREADRIEDLENCLNWSEHKDQYTLQDGSLNRF